MFRFFLLFLLLLLPTLMPVLVWLALDRRLIAAVLIESAVDAGRG